MKARFDTFEGAMKSLPKPPREAKAVKKEFKKLIDAATATADGLTDLIKVRDPKYKAPK